MEIKLIVLEGRYKDRVIPLPETIFLIGRDRRCHLRPHCPLVSKLHCAIAAWAGLVRLRDLKSRNGTLLNGELVRGEVAAQDGDRLQVGTLVLAFHVKNEDGTPVAAPIRDARQVQWLLDCPPDASVLDPACQTYLAPAPPRPRRGEESTAGGRAVSAGTLLRTYLETRKPRAAVPPQAN